MDAIATFADHVVRTDFDDLPDAAVSAAKTFILDTLGVGAAGSAGPWVAELLKVQGGWGAGTDARVWVHGTGLPAPAAAMCNAYQIHNAEFDCVHERAVVHSMTVLLAATLSVPLQSAQATTSPVWVRVTLLSPVQLAQPWRLHVIAHATRAQAIAIYAAEKIGEDADQAGSLSGPQATPWIDLTDVMRVLPT